MSKKNLKPIVSVSEMAKTVDLSRSRFYQLVENGIFPPPVYDLRSKRPFYDSRLQEICIDVKQNGIGVNGQFILFYAPRSNQPSKKKQPKQTDSFVDDILEMLGSMGFDYSNVQVLDAP